MLMTFDAASKAIADGKVLHIAGTEEQLRKLPKGKWIGGSTEYFMTGDGGLITGELLFVTEFPYETFRFQTYSAQSISAVAADAYDNGFTIVIVPFDSAAHREFAENAAGFPSMFMKNVTGWVAGMNLNIPGQTAIAVNGESGEILSDKAAALHLCVPDGKTVGLGIVNIFEQDENSPVIEFNEEGFSIYKCLIDGQETVLSDYITQNRSDTRLPIVGDYSGSGINISFKSIENGRVNLYAPVFSGIKYRIAKSIPDYAAAFRKHLSDLSDQDTVFSCNCILNFLYGELEGQKLDGFAGPITFGEIAYQLVNQTLVYVTVS